MSTIDETLSEANEAISLQDELEVVISEAESIRDRLSEKGFPDGAILAVGAAIAQTLVGVSEDDSSILKPAAGAIGLFLQRLSPEQRIRLLSGILLGEGLGDSGKQILVSGAFKGLQEAAKEDK